ITSTRAQPRSGQPVDGVVDDGCVACFRLAGADGDVEVAVDVGVHAGQFLGLGVAGCGEQRDGLAFHRVRGFCGSDHHDPDPFGLGAAGAHDLPLDQGHVVGGEPGWKVGTDLDVVGRPGGRVVIAAGGVVLVRGTLLAGRSLLAALFAWWLSVAVGVLAGAPGQEDDPDTGGGDPGQPEPPCGTNAHSAEARGRGADRYPCGLPGCAGRVGIVSCVL